MSRKKFKFSKLVRDKTPANLTEEGVEINYIPCKKNSEILSYYKKKLLEEAQEVKDSQTKEETIEELADCLEVINGLAKLLEIKPEEIEEIRQKKLASRGGFKDKILIESIELPSSSSWLSYFLKDPLKYPEIQD